MTPYRGKHNHLPRRISERVLDALLLRGHVAKWSKHLHLQGKLSITEHSVTLPPQRTLARPLKIAFASDFHAGPTTWAWYFQRPVSGHHRATARSSAARRRFCIGTRRVYFRVQCIACCVFGHLWENTRYSAITIYGSMKRI